MPLTLPWMCTAPGGCQMELGGRETGQSSSPGEGKLVYIFARSTCNVEVDGETLIVVILGVLAYKQLPTSLPLAL